MIVEDFINQEEKEYIKNLVPYIDFYWTDSTTSEKFPMFYHSLVNRPKKDEKFDENSSIQILSKHFNFFHFLVEKFCKKHNIKYSNIIRASLNATYHIPEYVHGDPHIDFSKEHYVVIIYLNNSDSCTLIFDEYQQFDNKKIYFDSPMTFPIKKKIKPEFGKICLFDGKYFHSNEIPSPGNIRKICVFNILK